MVLHGWKQIAQYLGCGIRTAQRWESQCGLPVTRPRNHLRSPVLAHPEALDSWAGGIPSNGREHWEARWTRLERDVEMLKRQIMVVAADESVAEGARSAVARDGAHPDGVGQQAAASFDA
jgi:hypothetical protein